MNQVINNTEYVAIDIIDGCRYCCANEDENLCVALGKGEHCNASTRPDNKNIIWIKKEHFPN